MQVILSLKFQVHPCVMLLLKGMYVEMGQVCRGEAGSGVSDQDPAFVSYVNFNISFVPWSSSINNIRSTSYVCFYVPINVLPLIHKVFSLIKM